MKTMIADEMTERLGLMYLGRGCEFLTNIISLKEFVAAVFSHFLTAVPALRSTRRFSAIADKSGRFVLDIDGRCFMLDGISSVEAVVYQQLADWLLTGCPGFVPIHAAALTAPDVGLILAGGRGSGKSTLTAALMEAGFKLLSDDAAVIETDRRRLHPFPRAIGLLSAADGLAKIGSQPIARLKLMPDGGEKVFYEPPGSAMVGSTAKLTHLFFLGDLRPSGELAIILANKLAHDRIDEAEMPVVESTREGLAFVRITPEGDLGEQLAACRRRGLLPLGVEPIKRERPHFGTHAKAVRLAADEALIRLWQSLKPAALTGERTGKLFYELGGLLSGLPAWAISAGTPQSTARLIVKITAGDR